MCVSVAMHWTEKCDETYKCRGNFQCNFSPGRIACNTDNSVITKSRHLCTRKLIYPHLRRKFSNTFNFRYKLVPCLTILVIYSFYTIIRNQPHEYIVSYSHDHNLWYKTSGVLKKILPVLLQKKAISNNLKHTHLWHISQSIVLW